MDRGVSMKEIDPSGILALQAERHTRRKTDTVRHRYMHTQERGDQALEELGPTAGARGLRQGASCGSHCPRREG